MQSFLGLDFSMHELYRDSNGNEPAYPKYYRNVEEKLVREQRRLSKMQKGSNNRSKQRIKVAKLHEKVSSQRKDFLHKLSRQLANAYDCVCIESLDMKAMSQMLNFGKSVSDNGWGMFTGFLKYKLEEQGKKLVKVDKFFASSQICSVCGSAHNNRTVGHTGIARLCLAHWCYRTRTKPTEVREAPTSTGGGGCHRKCFLLIFCI